MQSLSRLHTTLEKAEEEYGISVDHLLNHTPSVPSTSDPSVLVSPPSFIHKLTSSQLSDVLRECSKSLSPDDFVSVLSESFSNLSFHHLKSLLSALCASLSRSTPTNTLVEALDPVVDNIFLGGGFPVVGMLSTNLKVIYNYAA